MPRGRGLFAMNILPVLDVMAGRVVHGKAGRRETYQPIASRLCAGCAPLDIARAFRAHFGLVQLYVADLDAIAGAAPARTLFQELRREGFDLWVDAGVSSVEHAVSLRESGVSSVVVGLETLPAPALLDNLLAELGPDPLVFSLDLKHGAPMASSAWAGVDALGIARRALQAGVRRVLVLDLAAVGMDGGPSTLELCRRLRARRPDIEIATGGGVRGQADLDALRGVPVDHVLLASALHDGRIDLGRPDC
jgi:phosphoribosylformimino-5-aminoimidazole carboxamide ribotide isomerase